LLVGIAFLDELWSGVPVVGAPQIERDYGIAHAAMALAVLMLPQLAAAVIEARLVLWGMRGDPRRWIAAGQVTVCACALAGAVASSPWVLGFALAIASPASGVAGSIAAARLVEASPDGAERAMTRMSLAGALGDLAVPLLVGAVAWAGLPWRASLLVVAVLAGAHALAVLRAPDMPVALDAAEQESRDAVTLRAALRTPMLLVWLGGVAACALLDEILVAFAALHLRQGLGASEVVTAVALGAWALGWAVGLVVTERLLARFPARALLAGASIACAVATLAWLFPEEPGAAAAGLFALGAASAPLYPIALARAYAACPGRAALVDVAAQLFTPFEIALPFVVGVVADAWGVRVALAALIAQPLVLLALAFLAWPRPSRDARDSSRAASRSS
jgi:MFS family permease